MGNATILGTSFQTSLGPGASTTQVTGMGSCGMQSTAFEATGSEAQVQLKTRSAGIFSKVGAQIQVNGRSTASTIGLRVNGSSVNNAASVTASTTGYFRDTTNSDTIADGDLTCFRITTGSGSGNMVPWNIWIKLVATTGTIQYFSFKGNDNNLTQSSGGATAYAGIAGTNSNSSPESTEANCVHKLRAAGTASRLQCYIVTNSRSNTTTFNMRKNSGAGSGTFAVATTLTGLFEDTSNSDSYAAADTITFQFVTAAAGSGSIVIAQIACKYSSNSTDFELTSGTNLTGNGGFSTSVASYQPLIGSTEAVTTVEGSAKCRVMMSLKIDNFRVNQSANNSGTSVTATVRKNGADTALTLTITNNVTGMFEDTTHSFTVADGDDINVKFTNPNSTTYSQREVSVRADTSVTTDTGTPGTQRGIGLPGQ